MNTNPKRRSDGSFDSTHQLSRHPLYHIWCGMMARCFNKNHQPDYDRYGARGITVDIAWRDVSVFISDMEPTFSTGLTLERKDNNGPYSKINCVWATRKEQANNRRYNRKVTAFGFSENLTELARRFGIKRTTLRRRLDDGWDAERAISEPIIKTGRWA